MAQAGQLKKLAQARGISVRALLIDTVDGAVDYETAAEKLGITRQGLIQALKDHHLRARWVKNLVVSTLERNGSAS